MKALLWWLFYCAATAAIWLFAGWLPASFFALAVLVADELFRKAKEIP